VSEEVCVRIGGMAGADPSFDLVSSVDTLAAETLRFDLTIAMD
jgi:hypothetical protein